MTSEPDRPRRVGRDLERTITLTDAVVAIAMTLLVLPLVEISGEVDANDLGDVLRDNSSQLQSFVVSFVVIYVFWAAHSAAFHRARAHDGVIAGLPLANMLWLLVIAFLPFPTAIVGRDLNTGSGPFYLGTMFVLSALTSTIATLVDRATGSWDGAVWGWATTAVFGVATLVALVAPGPGRNLLLVLIPLRVVEGRLRRG